MEQLLPGKAGDKSAEKLGSEQQGEGLRLGEARETSLSKKEATTVRLGCGGKILESRASYL